VTSRDERGRKGGNGRDGEGKRRKRKGGIEGKFETPLKYPAYAAVLDDCRVD